MSRLRLACVAMVALLPALLTAADPPPKRGAPHYVPKFEAVAETKLLMVGLAQANYRGLEGLLKKEPPDAEAWAFARGQALLVAETGNLLLLRPPRTPEGQDTWFRQATDLRDAASSLARSARASAGLRLAAGPISLKWRIPAIVATRLFGSPHGSDNLRAEVHVLDRIGGLGLPSHHTRARTGSRPRLRQKIGRRRAKKLVQRRDLRLTALSSEYYHVRRAFAPDARASAGDVSGPPDRHRQSLKPVLLVAGVGRRFCTIPADAATWTGTAWRSCPAAPWPSGN